MIPLAISLILLSIWDDITGPIVDVFVGTSETAGMFGDPLLMGIFLFIIFLIFTFIFGLGMLVGSVVLIPALYLVFEWIPEGQIILAIILGLLFGMALNRLIRR